MTGKSASEYSASGIEYFFSTDLSSLTCAGKSGSYVNLNTQQHYLVTAKAAVFKFLYIIFSLVKTASTGVWGEEEEKVDEQSESLSISLL